MFVERLFTMSRDNEYMEEVAMKDSIINLEGDQQRSADILLHSKSPLQISKVFTTSHFAPDDPKKGLVKVSSLKVRTPGQVNGTIRRVVSLPSASPQHLPEVVVKRVGKTINSAPLKTHPTKVGAALQAQMDRLKFQSWQSNCFSKNNTKKNEEHDTSTTELEPSPENNVRYYRTDVEELIKENSLLRELLKECVEDAAIVREKMDKMTTVVSKVLKSTSVLVATRNKSHLKTSDNLKTSSKPSAPASKMPTISLPTFPLNDMNVLRRFEADLKSQEFTKQVMKHFYNNHTTHTMLKKPAMLLTHVLFSLVKSDVFKRFLWDKRSIITNGGSTIIIQNSFLEQFPNFQLLFFQLSNQRSKKVFGRSMSAEAVNKFLVNKISTLISLRLQKVHQVEIQMKAKNQLRIEMAKNKTNRQQEKAKSSQPDDTEDETEMMIEWLGNVSNEMFETAMNSSSHDEECKVETAKEAVTLQ